MPSGNPDQVLTDERLDSLESRMDRVEQWQRDSVPNGDAVGHRRYHELMIEAIEWRKRLWRAVMEKTVAGLVWGSMIAIGIACWRYFLSIVRGG